MLLPVLEVNEVSDEDQSRITWNGSRAGTNEVLPEGTYFYVLIEEGIDDPTKGYIELRK